MPVFSAAFLTRSVIARLIVAGAMAGSLMAGGVVVAADSPSAKTSFLDPQAAGVDFTIQGEYAADGWGLQVIAEGDGKFKGMLYKGGLPGAGWDGKKEDRSTSSGSLADGKTTLSGEQVLRGENANTKGSVALKFKIVIQGDTATVTHDGNDSQATVLKRVTRTSPTLGEKPAARAKVLFDGTNTDQWVNGAMTNDHLLKVGTRTKDKFTDYHLHLEFRSPYMPYARGQARGNSGMYLGDQYECQILDSFGLDGADNECGGIYQNAKPRVNMCLPPLSWQTYDVDFTAAKFDADGKVTAPARTTIRHNGVLIHDNISLKPTPGGGQNDQKPGAIFLQNHGDAVNFRNIWIVTK